VTWLLYLQRSYLQVTTLGEDEENGGSGEDSSQQMADIIEELSAELNSTEIGSGEVGSGEDDDDEDPIEMVHVDEDFFYMEHVMRLMAVIHSLVSLAMLIAYYHLKVCLNFDIEIKMRIQSNSIMKFLM
jgi:ryanodine receptor 2